MNVIFMNESAKIVFFLKKDFSFALNFIAIFIFFMFYFLKGR